MLSGRHVNSAVSVEKINGEKGPFKEGCNVWSLGGALKVLGWPLATPILRCSQGFQSAIGILLLCLVWTTDTVSNYPSYV